MSLSIFWDVNSLSREVATTPRTWPSSAVSGCLLQHPHTHTPHIHSAGTSKYASPYDAEVRLVGGDYRSHGAVEVYLNDRWGTVCTENMTLSNAHSVCRQMGYTGASSFSSPPEYVAIVGCNSGWLFDAHSSLQQWHSACSQDVDLFYFSSMFQFMLFVSSSNGHGHLRV